jgi:nucleotide-binding universal stress UspA family protein
MSNPIETMLVHIDGTEEAITAAQYGICVSKWTGARLIVSYVINTRALDDLVRTRIFLQEEQEEYRSDLEADAQRYLTHVTKMADEKGVELETVKASGAVYSEIKRLVKEYEVDLLLVKELSHVRSRRDEFYNEIERAMRGVPCSVLIVKDPDRVWDLFDNLA